MRIISGSLGGRFLRPNMKGWPTRPTTDISKEALFNILQNRLDFETIKMLDLFGGAGNHSFEFISRGCTDVTYVDLHYKCVKFVKNQALEFGVSDSIQTIRGDVKKFVRQTNLKYDYIFAGPPYPLPWLREIPVMIAHNELLSEEGLFVMEHNPNHDFVNHPFFQEKRNYGQTIFSFFAH